MTYMCEIHILEITMNIIDRSLISLLSLLHNIITDFSYDV
jgi:hypothetical protein